MAIYREKRKRNLVICSTVKAWKYLQYGCVGYLVYVVDRRCGRRQLSIDEVAIVNEFP